MHASPLVVAGLLVACNSSDRWPGRRPAATSADADATAVAVDRGAARRAGLAACAGALTAPPSPALDGGLAALLAGCTPCGASWQPLVALSTTDPEAEEPGPLPGPDEVLAILDACEATCAGNARSEATAALRSAQLGKSPSAPWRKIGEACHGALRVDARTRRFARGTWYALDQIARALWSEDVPAEVAAARDARGFEFPLPPYSEASTALALPRVGNIGAWSPRIHVTITVEKLHVGGLPFAQLQNGAITLIPSDQDYPGPETSLDQLDAALEAATLAYGGPNTAYNLANSPAVIAPRGMSASRLIEVLARMPNTMPHLAASPRDPGVVAWPEPLGVIPVFLSVGPASPGTEHVELPAAATVGDVAAALDELAGRKVARASLSIAAAPP